MTRDAADRRDDFATGTAPARTQAAPTRLSLSGGAGAGRADGSSIDFGELPAPRVRTARTHGSHKPAPGATSHGAQRSRRARFERARRSKGAGGSSARTGSAFQASRDDSAAIPFHDTPSAAYPAPTTHLRNTTNVPTIRSETFDLTAEAGARAPHARAPRAPQPSGRTATAHLDQGDE